MNPIWSNHGTEEGQTAPSITNMASYRRESVRINEVPSRLLRERIVFVPPFINDEIANYLIGVLLYLESDDATKEISLYINCHGSLDGNLYYGLGIYDTMRYLKPEITTVCLGAAQGVAAVLLAAGTKGKRFVLPHSLVVLHQPLSSIKGQASDIEIRARELLRQRQSFYEILAEHTGRSVDEIVLDADRRRYMNAKQAVEYGIADEVISREELAEK
ncbi:ATP-dependent Clp protease proteolytic subunit [Ktedonospora formicarum]|uniref:ATP-dependent Clp protease proteolytic subunit n=1 Tax=Ktedonospora formicarum TaxID=2778364 RepID=A0A8J3I2E9_9CHLR|nr:ATP-dependent Clp protease proteolytic subunit [Ktedonospora formicarum]GHO44808.1 ATP-dependent Clp protease proteolytic subunit [Ktedonospora formicarum]